MVSINTIGPRSDEDLSLRVRSYLHAKHVHSLRQLTVTAADGSVTLRGKLNTFHQKQLALNACRRVAGVRKIIDEISVVD